MPERKNQFCLCMNMMLVLSLLVITSYAACHPDDTYSTKYDNVNLESLLSNDRLYRKYLDCFTGVGKCTTAAQELKEIIPEALKTRCSKCSDTQKMFIEMVLKYTLDHRPDDYSALEKVWDPEGYYRKLWEVEAKS